eukprot:6191862-Pleurochrysis_carterae.AAC.1
MSRRRSARCAALTRASLGCCGQRELFTKAYEGLHTHAHSCTSRTVRAALFQAAAAQKFKSDRLAAAGASVVLDGNAPQAKGPKRRENRAGDERDDDDEEDDEDEDEDEDDEYAGYTVKDEMYNRDERDEATEREDYESLSRYLKAQREQRGRSGGQGNSS